MTALNELKKRLEPGRVYRRVDLARWSNSIDRHLQQLVKAGALEKLSVGVYYCPEQPSSGKPMPCDERLIRAFLKDQRFLIISPSAYKGVLTNIEHPYSGETVVYNHKRHGKFDFGERTFYFWVKPYFPNKVSRDFLLVDLVNNINMLDEDKETALNQIARKALRMNPRAMREAVKQYAGVRARKFFSGVLP